MLYCLTKNMYYGSKRSPLTYPQVTRFSIYSKFLWSEKLFFYFEKCKIIHEGNFKFDGNGIFLITDQHICWHYDMKIKVTTVRDLLHSQVK